MKYASRRNDDDIIGLFILRRSFVNNQVDRLTELQSMNESEPDAEISPLDSYDNAFWYKQDCTYHHESQYTLVLPIGQRLATVLMAA